MINLKLEELIYLLLTLDDEDNDDEIVNNYVGDSLDVLSILNELTKNVPVVLDSVQFDSEDVDNLYCISVEKYDDNSILVGIVNAVNPNGNKFYAINGNIFVSDYVSKSFEKDVKSYPYADTGDIIRVCLEDEDEDEDKIVTEKSDHMIHQAWSDGTSYYSRSFQSSDPKQLDKIVKEWSDFETKFKLEKK